MPTRPALFAVLLAALAGCGTPSTGSVTGTVTLDGQPLAGAAVSVSAANGEVVAAFSEADGRFTVADVPAGPCKVSVTFTEEDQAARDLDIKKGTKTAPKPGRKVPDKYTDPNRSELAVTVAAGAAAALDIKMTTK